MEQIDYDYISMSSIGCFDCFANHDSLLLKGKFKEIEELPKNVATPTSYTIISFMKDGKAVDERKTGISVSYFREKYGEYEVVVNEDNKPKDSFIGKLKRLLGWK